METATCGSSFRPCEIRLAVPGAVRSGQACRTETAAPGPAKPAAPKPPPPAPRKSTPPPPPTGPTATMEEAWEECCKANNNDEAQSTAAWGETIEKLFPGKNNSDLTPHDWGKLKEKFADNVPV